MLSNDEISAAQVWSSMLAARAILARFNGDRAKARTYCLDMADARPEARAEYTALADLVESLPRGDGQTHCDCQECREWTR